MPLNVIISFLDPPTKDWTEPASPKFVYFVSPPESKFFIFVWAMQINCLLFSYVIYSVITLNHTNDI